MGALSVRSADPTAIPSNGRASAARGPLPGRDRDKFGLGFFYVGYSSEFKGYRLAKNPSYPGMTDDYRRTHHFLEMLNPDIFLGSHTEWFNFEDKQKRTATEGVKAWINPEEYRRFVAKQKRAFEDQVDLETGVANPAKK
jgi:hypothetical protein